VAYCRRRPKEKRHPRLQDPHEHLHSVSLGVTDNGASLCNPHHQDTESNDIPAQAFWLWAGIENPLLPDGADDIHVDKWGDPFETPPWADHRDRIKYQSSRHLLALY